jgi:hypothetical protein
MQKVHYFFTTPASLSFDRTWDRPGLVLQNSGKSSRYRAKGRSQESQVEAPRARSKGGLFSIQPSLFQSQPGERPCRNCLKPSGLGRVGSFSSLGDISRIF